MKPLNMGVIGLGGISTAHIPTYQEDKRVKLVAGCDIDKDWMDYRTNELGIKGYADFYDLINDKNIDAVSVCLPNLFHKEATIAALEAGKHVLCEKPMAINAVEALAMHEASIKAGKKLMIRQNQRFESATQLLKKQIDAGTFGDIYHIRTAWRRPMGIMPSPLSWRTNGAEYSRNWFNEKEKGGGVLRDLGCHLLDAALYVTGFPKMVDVSCSAYRKFKADGLPADDKHTFDSEDLAVAHIKFENGMSMEFEVSFGSFIKEEVVFTDVYGTKAGGSRRNGQFSMFKSIDGAFTTETVRHCLIEGHDTSIEAFIDSIVNDTEPMVTSAQGVEIIRILDAMYESAGEIR